MTASMANSDTDWLRDLMPHFLEQTQDRLNQIKAHRQAILDGSDPIAAIKAICDVAHKISGTADTFGFSNLSVFAQNVEHVGMSDAQLSCDPKVIWSRMEPALTRLLNEIARLLETQ